MTSRELQKISKLEKRNANVLEANKIFAQFENAKVLENSKKNFEDFTRRRRPRLLKFHY